MSLISNIAPTDLGLPEKFGKWRTHQPTAIEQTRAAFKHHPVVGACMPAGSGKSLYYMALAVLLDEPICVLTATKGLQDQLLKDFAAVGLTDVRGKANYECAQHPPASCDDSAEYCPLAHLPPDEPPECTYKIAYERACKSSFLITNYAYWLAIHRYGNGLGHRGLLVCDEAHRIEEELERFLVVSVTDGHIERVLDRLGVVHDLDSYEFDAWRGWAEELRPPTAGVVGKLKGELDAYRQRDEKPPSGIVTHYKQAQSLLKKLNTIEAMGTNWIVDKHPPRSKQGWKVIFTPIDPGVYADRWLFAGIPKVLLTSATLTKADVKALRLDDYAFHSYPCEFERKLCPVYAVPGVRLKHNSSAEELKQWVEVIDSIIESRGVGRNGGRPRKGLIDTVSYDRQQYLVRHSRFRELMLANSSWGGADGSEKAPVVVDEFRRAEAPCVLVSPSFSEGWDFPGLDCEWIIAAKVAFPDTRSRVMRERVRRDKLLLVRLALRKASQLARRGMRSEKDYCEVFFVDENIRWVYWRNRELAAGWFEVQGKQVLPVKGRGWRERFGQ